MSPSDETTPARLPAQIDIRIRYAIYLMLQKSPEQRPTTSELLTILKLQNLKPSEKQDFSQSETFTVSTIYSDGLGVFSPSKESLEAMSAAALSQVRLT